MNDGFWLLAFIWAVLAVAAFCMWRQDRRKKPMPVLTLSQPFVLMVGDKATSMSFDGWQIDYPSGDVTATARRNFRDAEGDGNE